MNILDWFKTLLVPEQASVHASGHPATGPLPELEGSAELAGLDFQAAIRAHHAWKERLDALLQERSREQMDPVAICRDDLCELGQWIHGGGRRAFGHLEVFEDLRRHHADFHLVAAEVVHAARSGREDHARKLMESEYQLESEQVQSRLAELFVSHHH
ncbi:MAG: CZB domain-containing protein [Burkholderiales bacterium]|nr:CZB domain-containing protein [Burkholderiales bacterium]